MTLVDLRDRALSAVVNMDPLSKLPPQLVDQFIEYCAFWVWRALARQNESLFRKTVTLNDGDPLPADWGGFAYRAYYIVNSKRVPFFWTQVQKIARLQTSIYNQAIGSRPALHFAEQKINTLPAGLTNVVVSYYKIPPKLFGQADSTDDGLTPNASSYVWRAAAARCMSFFLPAKQAWAYDEKLRQEDSDSIKKFYVGLHAQNVRDIRNIS